MMGAPSVLGTPLVAEARILSILRVSNTILHVAFPQSDIVDAYWTYAIIDIAQTTLIIF